MKKRIAVEIETSEDGKACGSYCPYNRYLKNFTCSLFKKDLHSVELRIRRCPACIRAEYKAKEVEA
jgi:hypothetical protein